MKTKFTWDHHRIGEKIYSNDSGQLLFFIFILSAPRAEAFSGDFTTNLARQCRAFSRALKNEKLKAPLFRGPRGPGLQMTGALLYTKFYNLSRVLRKPAFCICENIDADQLHFNREAEKLETAKLICVIVFSS